MTALQISRYVIIMALWKVATKVYYKNFCNLHYCYNCIVQTTRVFNNEKYWQSPSSVQKELTYANFVNRGALFRQTSAHGPDLIHPSILYDIIIIIMEGGQSAQFFLQWYHSKQRFTAWHDASALSGDAEKPKAAMNTLKDRQQAARALNT